MDAETEFLRGLIELQYGQPVQSKLQRISPDVSWAAGWPHDLQAFWNAEAFMWGHKIRQETRDLISSEMKFNPNNNLDLGCGSYSYVPSTGFDISSKMLDFNDNCLTKIQGDLENPLPFKQEFTSVTAIFVLNYVCNYQSLLSEIGRILLPTGTFFMVLSPTVNDWQKQKQVNDFPADFWQRQLTAAGFVTRFYKKSNLLFFIGTKAKSY
jgi:ubiquinone/menaquinone biosynthesis C-methylase UbiE